MSYRTIIGLEVHVQLKTKSKMFCSCSNIDDSIGNVRYANTRVCPVCLGLPGVLPVANRQAIEWTLKTGLALNAEIAKFSKFDRKHYFYPDLPKNYQISQYDTPFCEGGFLEIEMPNGSKKINLTRIHLEEDAGKLVHTQDGTLIDLNRAGTPLMEVVTEPAIDSPSEAKIFMQELRSILRYLDVSDADMEKGHLRCDANISISPIADGVSELTNRDMRYAISDKLGTPVEIKNLNSFRMVERALLFEEKRQTELLEKGEKIVKETRGWNDVKGETYSQRSKEFAQDYRYFPEPDIPPFEIQGFDLEKIKSEIPELPSAKRKRYVEKMALPFQDAAILSVDTGMAAYFEKIAAEINPKLAANWVINELKMDGLLVVKPECLIELLERLEKKEISGKQAKEIFAEMTLTGEKPADIIVRKGIKQIIVEEEISEIIDTILNENQKSVLDYQKGKIEVLGFLIGKVMQKTKGQANPEIINKLLKEKITSL